MSMTTGTWAELMYANSTDFTGLSAFTTEASLLQGLNEQPTIPPNFFVNRRKAISLLARGTLSTTGTPTYTFQWRLGSTQGSSFLSGPSIGVSVAITTLSGVTTVWWESRIELALYTPGQGSNNATLSGSGYVSSPAGFAAPGFYEMEPTTPPTATWTATIDSAIQWYVNLSVTCSANSASNAVRCKQLWMWGWN